MPGLGVEHFVACSPRFLPLLGDGAKLPAARVAQPETSRQAGSLALQHRRDPLQRRATGQVTVGSATLQELHGAGTHCAQSPSVIDGRFPSLSTTVSEGSVQRVCRRTDLHRGSQFSLWPAATGVPGCALQSGVSRGADTCRLSQTHCKAGGPLGADLASSPAPWLWLCL